MKRMKEVLNSEEWRTFEKINQAIDEELEEFLQDAGEARAHFKLGAIVGITRTLQWIKIRKAPG